MDAFLLGMLIGILGTIVLSAIVLYWREVRMAFYGAGLGIWGFILGMLLYVSGAVVVIWIAITDTPPVSEEEE